VQVVCFDVDSSFCIDESIDEIAAFLGRGEEVAALTRAAMSGGVSFQDALKQRLEVIKPTKKDIARFKREHPAKLSKGTEPYWYHAIASAWKSEASTAIKLHHALLFKPAGSIMPG
jgi:phosphoserine phosphatase